MPIFKEKEASVMESAESDATYALLPESERESFEDSQRVVRRLGWSKTLKRLTVFNGVLFVTSLCCLGWSLSVYGRSQSIHEKEIVKRTTFFSPPLDTFTPNWAPKKFMSHPISSHKSIFRQDPSPEVDAAWDRVSDLGVLTMTHDQIVALGKDPSGVVKAPPDWNVGSDAYLGLLDGVHLLHCLNAMRKSLYFNYDYYYPHGHPATYGAHLSHCQEAVAQWLMCQSSLEVIPFDWVERHELPFPDFDVTRQCRNFDQLLAWQEENRVQSVNSATWNALRMPEDTVPNRSPLLNDETLNHTWAHLEGHPSCLK